MKFEYYLLQLKFFQMRPITIFYGKPFFILKKNSSHIAMNDPVQRRKSQHFVDESILIEFDRFKQLTINVYECNGMLRM